MKHFLITIIIIFTFSTANSQDSFDVGIFTGASFYLGDVNKQKFFYNPKLAFGGLIRANLSNRYAVRANLTKLNVSGSDLDFNNEYQQSRMHLFNSTLYDFNAQFEFYFLDYSPHDDGYNFTPYISAGFGGAYYSVNDIKMGYLFNIPFSMGFRVRLTEHISAGGQWEFKKNFKDDIDGLLDNSFPDGSLFGSKQKNYTNDKDWYSYAGIFLTFTLYKPTGLCHAYGKSYKFR